jgi:hypothetical protein
MPPIKRVWRRLLGRVQQEAIEQETEKAQMSPDERRITATPVEDLAADNLVEQLAGGNINLEGPPSAFVPTSRGHTGRRRG